MTYCSHRIVTDVVCIVLYSCLYVLIILLFSKFKLAFHEQFLLYKTVKLTQFVGGLRLLQKTQSSKLVVDALPSNVRDFNLLLKP